MLIAPHLFASDTALGRLDYALLSDQAKMEILVDGLSSASKAFFQDASAGYRDIAAWPSVLGNADHPVVAVHWKWMTFQQEFAGSLNFDFVPAHVRFFMVYGLGVEGTLSTPLLPRGLVDLHLDENALSGTLDLTALPDPLKVLRASVNKFSGSVNLSLLPANLEVLHLDCNCLVGSIDLAHLPDSLQQLCLSDNAFEGEVTLNNLPDALETLNIMRNKLCGEFVLLQFPQRISMIQASGNRFCGEAVVSSAYKQCVYKQCVLGLQSD